jgi:hypothetical protein
MERLAPFDRLPANFWLFVVVALIMLGISAAIIYNAL